MTGLWVPPSMELRPVEDPDHAWLVELHNDPEVLNNTRDPRPITMEQHAAWWVRTKDSPSEARLVFTMDGERIGFTKFYAIDRYNKHCVLGADIHPTHRGRGLAKYMWSLMLAKCFDEWKLHRVGLSTMEYNLVARRVYQGLGFKVEGVIKHCHFRGGEYHDAVCMYMLRDDWVGP